MDDTRPHGARRRRLAPTCISAELDDNGEIRAHSGSANHQGRRHPDAIIAVELDHALTDPDPLRGIAQLTARLGAAFTLDPGGVTRTKALGTERMARKLRDALPGGENDLRAALWEFMRPMLSPALVDLNRDAFVSEAAIKTTVDLAGGPRRLEPRRRRPGGSRGRGRVGPR